MKTKPIINWTDIKRNFVIENTKQQDWQRLTNPTNDRMEVEEYTE